MCCISSATQLKHDGRNTKQKRIGKQCWTLLPSLPPAQHFRLYCVMETQATVLATPDCAAFKLCPNYLQNKIIQIPCNTA